MKNYYYLRDIVYDTKSGRKTTRHSSQSIQSPQPSLLSKYDNTGGEMWQLRSKKILELAGFTPGKPRNFGYYEYMYRFLLEARVADTTQRLAVVVLVADVVNMAAEHHVVG